MNWLLHLQRMPQNRIPYTTTVHKEREQLGDRRNVGESSCNSGDGTGQMAQPLIFMMMMMMVCVYALVQGGLFIVITLLHAGRDSLTGNNNTLIPRVVFL
jgi:hypothetical protein